MPSFPYFLKEIIAEEFQLDLVNPNTLRLLEPKTNLSVDIKIKKSDSIFCFSIDKDRVRNSCKGDGVFPFFNPCIGGLCIKNDFILVCQEGKKIYVFLIELKSKNEGHYLKQIHAGKIFFDFVLERSKLCDLNSDFKDISTIEISYKGILFLREIPGKGTSKQKKLTLIQTRIYLSLLHDYRTVVSTISLNFCNLYCLLCPKSN